jgi:hypothetical protein
MTGTASRAILAAVQSVIARPTAIAAGAGS